MFPWPVILCFVLFVPLNAYLGIRSDNWFSWVAVGFISGMTFASVARWAMDRS